MKRALFLSAALIFTWSLLAAAADSPAPAPSWQTDLAAWRGKRAASLQAPEGWLSLIGLEWLKGGDNSVGSAPDNQIQIAKAPAPLGGAALEKGGAIRLSPP